MYHGESLFELDPSCQVSSVVDVGPTLVCSWGVPGFLVHSIFGLLPVHQLLCRLPDFANHTIIQLAVTMMLCQHYHRCRRQSGGYSVGQSNYTQLMVLTWLMILAILYFFSSADENAEGNLITVLLIDLCPCRGHCSCWPLLHWLSSFF